MRRFVSSFAGMVVGLIVRGLPYARETRSFTQYDRATFRNFGSIITFTFLTAFLSVVGLGPGHERPSGSAEVASAYPLRRFHITAAIKW